MFYVKASKALRKAFREFVYVDGTAKDFAKTHGIGYDVLLDYMEGKHAIPFVYIKKLAEANRKSVWEILAGEIIKPRSSENPFKIPNSFTSAEANLIGWVLSEGHLATNTLQISQKNKDVLIALKSLLEKCFDLKKIIIVNDRDNWKLIVYNSAFRHCLYLKYGIPIGKKSHSIQVPKQIYNCGKQIVVAFLAGCLEGDGDFSFYIRTNSRGRYRVPRIGLNSASFSFLRGIKKLLRLLGVSCKVYSYRTGHCKTCYKLSIFRAEDCANLAFQLTPFLLHPERITQVQKILGNKELLNMIHIGGKGLLFKRLKQNGVSFDEFARVISERYNYKVVENTARNWSFDLFAPPLSAIILACEVLGENIRDYIPRYLFPLAVK